MSEIAETLFCIYLMSINLVTFVIYGIDKQRAKKKQWRISEKTLFVLAILGGSVGALGGMYYFRHKTQKEAFKFGIPVILAIQMLALWWIQRLIL